MFKKVMSLKWFDEYKKINEKLRLLSKLAVFSVFLFSILSLYDIVKFFQENPKYFEFQFFKEIGLIPAIFFQLTILVLFAVRFVLLFFKSTKLFWLNQVIYITGIFILALYFCSSRPTENSYGIYQTHMEIFRHTAKGFDFFGVWYLFLSPIRFVVTLIFALIKSK